MSEHPAAADVQPTLARALADTAEVEASRARVRAGLLGRERAVTHLLAASFVLAAVACAALVPSSTEFSFWTAALFVACYAAVSQIEFEVGPGSAVPTQLVLVPMLFALPPGLVPALVASGLVLAGLVEQARARRHGERVAILLCAARVDRRRGVSSVRLDRAGRAGRGRAALRRQGRYAAARSLNGST